VFADAKKLRRFEHLLVAQPPKFAHYVTSHPTTTPYHKKEIQNATFLCVVLNVYALPGETQLLVLPRYKIRTRLLS